MTDWNPTDDELRMMAKSPIAPVRMLARLVLRERAEIERVRERDRGWNDLYAKEAARAEKAEATLARVEALCDEREAPAWGNYSGLLMAKWIREALAGASPARGDAVDSQASEAQAPAAEYDVIDEES